MKNKFEGYQPGLAIIQVGDRQDSNVYIRMKIRAAAEIGITCTHHSLPSSSTQMQILNLINELNNNPLVHGIIVQMALDCNNEVDSHLVTDSVLPEKDVDGLHTVNEGKLAVGDLTSFIPCTPNGVLQLIKRSGINISGSKTVVIGRSKILGTPASELLKWNNATATVCHSKSKNIEKIMSETDILMVAIGKPQYIHGSWIKPGAVVIDCGINSILDETKPSGQRLAGDVNYEEAFEIASYITPVPGGVGPMTIAMLMRNTALSAQSAVKKLTVKDWSLSLLPLNILRPIPSDIEISRAQTP